MNPDSLKACHEAVTETLGAPSVLLNAAGGNDPDATVTPEMPFENIPLPAWAKVFDLNLVGGLLLPLKNLARPVSAARAALSTLPASPRIYRSQR